MSIGLSVAALLALLWWEVGGPPWRISPDGQYYLQAGAPRPYGLRWLLPWLCRSHVYWWIACSYAAIAATALIVGWHAGVTASVLFLGLASTRTNAMFPILTDQLGMLLLLGGVMLPWPWNLVSVGIGAMVNEKVPVFAAAWTSEIRLLLPLGIVWFAWRRSPTPSEQSPDWLRRPWTEARKKAWEILDARQLLLPWGIAAIGLLHTPPLALLLAYAQLAFAQDRARLYQWIAPMVVMTVPSLIPPVLLVPLLVLHWLNPWRRVL